MYNVYREQLTFKNYETLEYDRKSRSDDPDMTIEEVLETHAKILDEYAEKYLGGKIPEENKFKEVGSSETIKGRPEMVRLLRAVENPKYKAVLVIDVQRLSRGDMEENGRLIKILRYSNTCIITPMKIYDLRDEYDRDAFERELKRGNDYLEYFKKIQRRGKLASVKAGNYVGSVAPYGFDRIPIKDGKKNCFKLIEKKEEADVVRMVFNWYCNEDIGVTSICRRLENMNIKTKTGANKWKPTAIFTMLENVHYIGKVRWNWRQTIKIIEDQEVKSIRPKAKVDEYLVYEGKHDPIISEELFYKAQKIRGTRHRTKTSTTLKNPLSGLMYCKCGSKIGYNTYNKNGVEFAPPKLVCNNQVYCKTGSADFSEVMKYICKTLRDCIDDFEMRIDNKQDDSAKLYKNMIVNLEKKLKDLELKEIIQWNQQSDPNPENRMPEHVFKVLNESLLKEKEEVKEALCKAEESAPQEIDYKERIIKFTDALKALEDPNIEAVIKNHYLKDIIERIDYDRPQIIKVGSPGQKGLMYKTEPYKIKITLRP